MAQKFLYRRYRIIEQAGEKIFGAQFSVILHPYICLNLSSYAVREVVHYLFSAFQLKFLQKPFNHCVEFSQRFVWLSVAISSGKPVVFRLRITSNRRSRAE